MTKKIAMLHYSGPPVIGGVEAVLQAHARQFVQAGLPTALIAGCGDESALPAGCEFIHIPELDSRHPGIVQMAASLEGGIVPPEFTEFTRRLTDELRPVVSRFDHLIVHNVFTKHFNLPLTAALFSLLDEGAAHGVIAWCHDLSWSSPTSRKKIHEGNPWNLLRSLRADVTYVAVSNQRKKEMMDTFSLPADRVRVIYNGIDSETLLGLSPEGSALITRLGLKEADIVLLMPVRVTRAKNIEYALDLLAAFKKDGYHPRLVVTGPPDPHDPESLAYLQELTALRRKMNLEQELRFVYESGPVPGEPYMIDQHLVAELLRSSDLMFMPSHHEGFGLPVLEAALIGIPVVTTAVPSAKEIAFEDAFVFSLNTSPDMLVEQLLNWMEENPQFRLRNRVKQEYTWEVIYQKDIRPLFGSVQ